MNLAYHQEGEGSPLIVLHGLLGSKKNWKVLSSSLARKYNVYTLDLRNHGDSPHVDSMLYDEMADDLKEFMDQNKIESCSILGHSMGGKIAMVFALLYPERVHQLLIADIAPRNSNSDHEHLLNAMQAIPIDHLENRGEADQMLKGAVPETSLRQFLLTNLARKDGKFYWRVNIPIILASVSKLIRFPDPGELKFQGESLFIRGDKSDYLTEEDLPEIKNLFPNYELETIKDAGHWLHAEKPKEFFQVVDDFLF
jgi:esterase